MLVLGYCNIVESLLKLITVNDFANLAKPQPDSSICKHASSEGTWAIPPNGNPMYKLDLPLSYSKEGL